MQLGDMLINEGIITADQLAKALAKQKTNPEQKLGEILLGEGMIDIDTFTKVLDKQMKEQGLSK